MAKLPHTEDDEYDNDLSDRLRRSQPQQPLRLPKPDGFWVALGIAICARAYEVEFADEIPKHNNGSGALSATRRNVARRGRTNSLRKARRYMPIGSTA